MESQSWRSSPEPPAGLEPAGGLTPAGGLIPVGDQKKPVRLTRYRRHDRLTDWSLSGVEMVFSKAMRLLIILCFTMLGFVCIVNQAAAQAPGYADIHEPLGGEAIDGVVTIEGSASHPSFVSYDLSFSHSDNPTGTWFLIGDAVRTPVVNGRLGLWDTTGITDGFYTLRLRVHLSNNIVLESLVEGLRIRNSTAIETATPQPDRVTATPSITLPTRTPRPTPLPFPGGSSPSTVLQTFTGGIIAGVVVLLSLGIYLFIRRRSQERWSVLRMRQMLRNANRKKRR